MVRVTTPTEFEQRLLQAGHGNAKGARRYLESIYCRMKNSQGTFSVRDSNVISQTFERRGWDSHANRIRQFAILAPGGRLRYDCRKEDLTPEQLACYVEDMASAVRNNIAGARNPKRASHISSYRSSLVLLLVSMKTAISSGTLPRIQS